MCVCRYICQVICGCLVLWMSAGHVCTAGKYWVLERAALDCAHCNCPPSGNQRVGRCTLSEEATHSRYVCIRMYVYANYKILV